MKLFVEVELSSDEIPLATELFRTLRALTEHVKIRDVGKLFQSLIWRLEDGTQLDRVSNEVATLLTDSPEMAMQTLEEFQGAFVAVVFNHDLVLRQKSVVPFMYLLPRLPDHAKSRMRDFLIPKVLKHLTVKRPVEASRMEFFAHAEAFAALVNLEFVSINGAITTIITLLRKPETRCAAVTMLGKTVELCLQQLTEKCNSKTLQELNTALQSVTEDAFQYDINYIEESMSWSRPLHGMGGLHDLPSSGSLSTHGDLNKGLTMDSSSTSSGMLRKWQHQI
ncbi:uncharacterized protein [Physcomitrium patens]|uniref:Uncharacterized protein n=1 Tax=Physcomitrium patens TaxID=3218 RepID=A0A7I4BIW4_PHYPA|nr:uncharacterized protein LOC112294607 isoform X1 [Physcomitrium patens]|eukprot:XP_024401026.1 uncharacterized protein LOC112294607 isoform X1 [Physcomitrella patens]